MYTDPHMVLAWGGPLGPENRADTWSVSLRFRPSGASSQDTDFPPLRPADFPSQLRADIVAALSAFHSGSGARMRNDAVLQWIKFNRVDREGKYVSPSLSTQWDITGVAGAGAPAYPQQIALATTYRTEARRGPGTKGRTFWPTAIDYDPSIGGPSTSARTGLAGSVGGLLTTLGSAMFRAGFTLVPSVMSPIGEGQSRFITRVEVGSRFDVQRRRDNSERESYVGADVALPTA